MESLHNNIILIYLRLAFSQALTRLLANQDDYKTEFLTVNLDLAVLDTGTTCWQRKCDYVLWIATHIGITKIDCKQKVSYDLARKVSIANE